MFKQQVKEEKINEKVLSHKLECVLHYLEKYFRPVLQEFYQPVPESNKIFAKQFFW